MKKYLVIGNPIGHSLSPQLHNYWISQNNIDALYERRNLDEKELKNLVLQIKEKKLSGANITIPFKNIIIPYLDELTDEAKKTQSVNTVYLNNEKVVGHNTDIGGFEIAIDKINFTLVDKTVLGLNIDDKISLDFSNIGKNKLFYDIIYNPSETNFLKIGKESGNKCENGRLMFIYQAFLAFKLWHGIEPKINNEIINLLKK